MQLMILFRRAPKLRPFSPDISQVDTEEKSRCVPDERAILMNKIRILIVDDSSVMRKNLERSLRQAGVELSLVHQAGNGAEALAVLAENQADLILCDINIPVMDGLEFVKHLPGVENPKGAPVIMITTEGSESHVVQALSAGAKGYIRKPFPPSRSKITFFHFWGLKRENSRGSIG
jgi:two-component system chemotaxis response regulator CheY